MFIPMLCLIAFIVSFFGIWILSISLDGFLVFGILFFLFCLFIIALLIFLFYKVYFRYSITRVKVQKDRIILYHGSKARATKIPFSKILKSKHIIHNGVPCMRFDLSQKEKICPGLEEGVLLTILFDERIQDEIERAYNNYKKNNNT